MINKLRLFLICFVLLLSECSFAYQFEAKKYYPLSKKDCYNNRFILGLRYCNVERDYLAGAAKACGNINNLPSGDELHRLAQMVYDNYTSETSIYGVRNDRMLKNMGIWVNDSHIFYWTNGEASDGVGGYVRMFATRGSIPYYAPRDGSGYVSHKLGKIRYGNTKNIRVYPKEFDSNLTGMPNNDVLLTICRVR